MTKEIMLQGIIIANDFDANGTPIHFAILTDDESKYLLETVHFHHDVFSKFNRKKVRVMGHFGSSKKGQQIITVSEIKPLGNTSTPDLLDVL